MDNMRQRIFVWVMTILLLLILTSPVTQTLTVNANSRMWSPGLVIETIGLTHASGEPTEIYNEYVNKTHQVVISIENTGNIVLTNLNISYCILRDPVIDLTGEDQSKTKLKISESYDLKFDWTPGVGDGTNYFIKAIVTATSFGITIGPMYKNQSFIINDVKNDIGPVDYYLGTGPSLGVIANHTHDVTAVIKNFGNFKLSTSFSVSASIFSQSTMQQLWNDSKLYSNSVFANEECEVPFTNPWQPPKAGDYFLNLTTSLVADSKPENDNSPPLPIHITNVTDAGITGLSNLIDTGIYSCIPITVIAQITNTGNLNLTVPFSTTLRVNSYPTGTNIYTAPLIQVPISGPQNVSTPGSCYNAIFSPWDFTHGLKEGIVWINISIDSFPIEQNGSSFNNNYSIMIEVKNWTNVGLEILYPKEGLYYIEDITEVIVNVSNLGTEDLTPYVLNLSIRNENSDEFWENYSGQSNPTGLPVEHFETHTFSDWDFAYNTKFYLTATLYTSSPMKKIATATRTFELKGGKKNGTITGLVFDADDHEYIPNIIIKVYEPLNPTPKYITTTSVNGNFSIEVEAPPNGHEYSVVISDSDNYWWYEECIEVEVFSGRTEHLNFILYRQPTGYVKGSVKLIASVGAPEVVEEWSEITLSVEDTPITSSTDKFGKFDIELVAGVVNISASKSNYETARLEYVTISPGSISTIEFTLFEAWAVEVSPANNVSGVNTQTNIVADFDTSLDVTSINLKNFGILDEDGKLLTKIAENNYYFIRNNKTCIISPPNQLNYNTTYQILITPELKTHDGLPAVHRSWLSSFTTEIGYGELAGVCTYYWNRMPIENVNVGLNKYPKFNTKTDDNGFFIMENLPIGEFQIDFSMEGQFVKTEYVTIVPGRTLWVNVTFDDELPIPKLWGNNQIGKKILIFDNITSRIKVDTDFTLTCNIPLAPKTVNSDTVLIIDKSSGEPVNYREINGSENKLSFLIDPEEDLKYDTIYQVIYKKELETYDGRKIFSNVWNYGNFTTEPQIWQMLSKPIIKPYDKEVNVPINSLVSINFSLMMNKSSVERSINASFNVTGFTWHNNNMTVHLEHEKFNYFTKYTITLAPDLVSANGISRWLEWVNTSFTTVSGLLKYIVGPVQDDNGKPVLGVSVVIYDSFGIKVESSRTNSTGFALFYFETLLPPGNYSLTFMKHGYKIITVDFIVNETGELIIPESLPQMNKIETEDGFSMLLIVGIILIIMLVIIMIISIFFLKFKSKHPDERPEDEPIKIEDEPTKEKEKEMEKEKQPTAEQLLNKVKTESGSTEEKGSKVNKKNAS